MNDAEYTQYAYRYFTAQSIPDANQSFEQFNDMIDLMHIVINDPRKDKVYEQWKKLRFF